MNFTLDQLRAFLAVAETGSVGRAAQRLCLTQPAASARIKALETAIGASLFDRTDKMALTRDGASLIRYAEQFLTLTSLVERDVSSTTGVSRLLRIGVSETIVQSWLPNFIQNLRAEYPNISVEIDVDDSLNLRERLLNNAIDFALLMGPVSDYRVENVPLPSFEMSWFRSPQHPQMTLGAGTPVITFSRTTRPHRQLKEYLLETYGPDTSIFPSSSLSACFRMVAMGLGIGALPVSPARPFIERGEVARLELPVTPDPLDFTASFTAGPEASLERKAALIARETALEFDKLNLSI